MRFSGKFSRLSKTAVLVAVGIILWVFEELIPHPIPFVRLGLGNIVTLIALETLGFPSAFMVAALRTFLGALILGRLFSPNFWFSFSGGIVSVIVMAMFFRFRSLFSIVGVSIAGAFAHTLTQLIVAAMTFYSFRIVIQFLPLLGISSVIAGIIIGFIASYVVNAIEHDRDR
mgnify:CR=1 FL=1